MVNSMNMITDTELEMATGGGTFDQLIDEVQAYTPVLEQALDYASGQAYNAYRLIDYLIFG